MADFDWSPYAVGGATRPDAFSGMNAQFQAALQGLLSSAPEGVRRQLQVYSGYRSPKVQAGLYDRALQKYGSPAAARQWVAPPNKSQHGKGMAADLKYLSPQAMKWVRENAPAHGLSFPLRNEPWHVELSTARNPNAKPPAPVPTYDDMMASAKPASLAYAATPTPRPSSNPFDALLSPSAPTEQMATFRATPSPVQREALPDVTPASFDNSRFGPAPAQTFDQSRFGNPAPASSYFDYSGLLSEEPQQPSAFDQQRLGPTAPVAATPQQLQRGLLDQQLNAGILPDLMAPATNWPGQVAPAAAPTTPAAYTEPMGDYEPASIKTARVQAPEVQSGLLSQPEYQQVQQQQALLGGPMAHSTPEQMQAMAAQASKGMQNRSLGGGLLGGLLGGLTLGPIGAIAGGLLGRNVAKNSYFPDRPKSQSRGDGSMTDYGKSVSNSSGQFREAMSKGGRGLY